MPKSDRRYDKIAAHFLPLKRISLIARYLSDRCGPSYRTFEDYMTLGEVRQSGLGHHLKQVQKSVGRLLDGPR